MPAPKSYGLAAGWPMGGGQVRGLYRRPSMVSSFNAFPNARVAAAGTNLYSQGRQGHKLSQAVTNLQAILVGSYIVSGTGAETAFGNTVTSALALEIGANVNAFTWGGAGTIDVASGSIQFSDPVANVAAGQIYTRFRNNVAAAALWFPDYDKVCDSTQGYVTDNTKNFLLQTGAINPTGLTGGPSPQTVGIIGIPTNPEMSVGLFGDSIGDGKNDSNTSLTGGYYSRAMLRLGLPWSRSAVQASGLQRPPPSAAPLQMQLIPYHTDIIIQDITNNVASAATLATCQGYIIGIINAIKQQIGPNGYPPRVHVLTCLPRSSGSSDQFTTIKGQTIENGFEVGGVRDQYNAWLYSYLLANNLIDGVCDISPGVEDQLNHGYWQVNGTPSYMTVEGIHPQPPGHIACADILYNYLLPFSRNVLIN